MGFRERFNWLLQVSFAAGLLAAMAAGCATADKHEPKSKNPAAARLSGTRATYCSVPRKPDGRADLDKLVAELLDLGANTYSFCIHSAATDWDDFQLFLPKA